MKKWSENLNLPTQLYRPNDVFEKKPATNKFNIFFINIGPDWADDIPTVTRSFKSYVQKANKTQKVEPVTINELKAFFSFKINKNSGYDEISFNVPKLLWWTFWSTKHTFNLSFEKGIFADYIRFVKINRFLKRTAVQILVIIGQYMYFLVFPKFLKWTIKL